MIFGYNFEAPLNIPKPEKIGFSEQFVHCICWEQDLQAIGTFDEALPSRGSCFDGDNV